MLHALREIARYLRWSLAYRAAVALGRWTVTTPEDSDGTRFRRKGYALAYAEGMKEMGQEWAVSRRGPGFGRSFWYYPPGRPKWEPMDVATSLRELWHRL